MLVPSLPAHFCIADLCLLIETYLEPAQVKEVYRAFLFSAEAHDGQLRKAGEPYIFHPLTVAYILGHFKVDVQTLCAALLHDVIEDTGITKEKLASEFGEVVAELVDGVSKLSAVQFKSREEAQAATFLKMLLAMSRDIRVILVKLADRLHNLRTLSVMTPESRRRIAKETLEIYSPIASRLGMNAFRIELEELCFAAIYPLRHQVLLQRTQRVYSKRFELFHTIQTNVEQLLKKNNIKSQLLRREKHHYGLYYKMREKKGMASIDKRKTFTQVTNMCAFRIIVETKEDCYRVLGLVHSLYKPICERFKDYIAIPKINGYQSLHTVLFSPHGLLIELQIRTVAMHDLSEYGITAQGLYQTDSDSSDKKQSCNTLARQYATEWLRNLVEIEQNSDSDALEFLNHIKHDLFPEEVYVFTPQGKILQLPKGSTALDFAYAIHSDVGNQCIAAKVENQYVSLSTALVSGQTIEVITATWARPNPSWLDFAISARARLAIRQFLKNLQHDEAILLGKRMLDKELATYSLTTDKITVEQRTHLLEIFKVNHFDTLLADIGLGNRIAVMVARQLEQTTEESKPNTTTVISPSPLDGKAKKLTIKGTEGILVNFSRCCRPIPGDEIVGFISTGRGLIIHTANCNNVIDSSRYRPEKFLAVEWEPNIEGEFLVDIRIEVKDQRGVLALVAGAITNLGSNIESVANEKRSGINSEIKFCISVRHRDQLADIMRHLRRLEAVTKIQRSRG